MPAYLIADIEVTDAEGYDRYRKGVSETIAAFGGRYLARGGKTEVLEGEFKPQRFVIVEFPTMARLREWYDSPQYRPLLDLRTRCSKSRLLTVEGI